MPNHCCAKPKLQIMLQIFLAPYSKLGAACHTYGSMWNGAKLLRSVCKHGNTLHVKVTSIKLFKSKTIQNCSCYWLSIAVQKQNYKVQHKALWFICFVSVWLFSSLHTRAAQFIKYYQNCNTDKCNISGFTRLRVMSVESDLAVQYKYFTIHFSPCGVLKFEQAQWDLQFDSSVSVI